MFGLQARIGSIDSEDLLKLVPITRVRNGEKNRFSNHIFLLKSQLVFGPKKTTHHRSDIESDFFEVTRVLFYRLLI